MAIETRPPWWDDYQDWFKKAYPGVGATLDPIEWGDYGKKTPVEEFLQTQPPAAAQTEKGTVTAGTSPLQTAMQREVTATATTTPETMTRYTIPGTDVSMNLAASDINRLTTQGAFEGAESGYWNYSLDPSGQYLTRAPRPNQYGLYNMGTPFPTTYAVNQAAPAAPAQPTAATPATGTAAPTTAAPSPAAQAMTQQAGAGADILAQLQARTDLPPEVMSALGVLGPSQAVGAQAVISDYQTRLDAAQQAQGQIEQAGETYTAGMDKWTAALQDVARKAELATKAVATGGLETMKRAEEHLKGVLERGQEARDDFTKRTDNIYQATLQQGEEARKRAETQIQTAKGELENLTAQNIQAKSQGIDAYYDDAIRAAKVRANVLGDPGAEAEVRRLEGQRIRAMAPVINESQIYHNNQRMALNMASAQLDATLSQAALTTGAGIAGAGLTGYATLMEREDMFASFAGQALIDASKAVTQMNMVANSENLQTQMAVAGLERAGMVDYANWIMQSPILEVSMGGVLMALSELAEQYKLELEEQQDEAEMEARRQEMEAQAATAQPTTRTSGSVSGGVGRATTPARTSPAVASARRTSTPSVAPSIAPGYTGTGAGRTSSPSTIAPGYVGSRPFGGPVARQAAMRGTEITSPRTAGVPAGYAYA